MHLRSDYSSPLLKDQNVTIWNDAEANSYLDGVGADGAYMSSDEGGIIIVRPEASYTAVVEEMIHHNQSLLHGEENFLKNRNQLEIEAQDELLRIGEAEGWGADEMDRTRAAHSEWVKQLEKEQSSGGSSSGTGG